MTTRLEYEVTVDDHIAKLERFVQGSPVGRNFTWFAYGTIVALAWLSAILFYVKQGGHQNYGYVFSGFVALMLTLTLPTLYRWYQNSFWASVFTPAAVQGLVGRKVLEVHADFIEEIGDVFTIRACWRDLQRIDDDSRRIWMVFAPLLVIVIPNGAFHDSSTRESFLRECREHLVSQARIAEHHIGQDAADNMVSRNG